MPAPKPPRLDLGVWPTPIRHSPAISEQLGVDVWVKFEEECGAWGGNKVRKLEHILAEAHRRKVRSLLAYGVGTSNWTSALALHAARQGFAVKLFLWGDPPEPYRRLYAATSTIVQPVGRTRVTAGTIAGLIAPERPGAWFLPPGGSGPYGDIGSVSAGLEIAESVNAGEMPRPALVFVALGTAGTSAGLAAGLAAGGVPAPVVAAKVAAWPYGATAMTRSRAARQSARLGTRAPSPIIEDTRFFAPGYAQPNPASAEAIEIGLLDALVLDGTYAAKAFASLVSHARSGHPGPYLFVHTSPGPPPEDPFA